MCIRDSIHTANDTLANMSNSAANSAKFAKLGLAFLGEAAKTAGTSGGGGTDPAIPLTKGVAVTGPVSYTHLDVYKRQLLVRHPEGHLELREGFRPSRRRVGSMAG